ATIDEIAHDDVTVLGCAKVAHRRDPGSQCLPGILLCEKHGLGATTPPLLRPGLRPRLLIPVVRHVRMHVDQARDARQRPEIDDRGSGGNRLRPRADTRYALTLN